MDIDKLKDQLEDLEEQLVSLRKELPIDKDDLDVEIQTHPSSYYDVSELGTLAASTRDFVKEYVARLSAELAHGIRSSAEKDKRITDTAVNQAILETEKYQEAQDVYLNSRRVADLCEALKISFTSRGQMLRELSSLWIAGYYSDKTAKGSADTREAAHKIRRKKLSDSRRKT